MVRVRRVMCPVDFGDNAREALNFAIGLGGDLGARLLLVHVAESAPALPLYTSDSADAILEPSTSSSDDASRLDALVEHATSCGLEAEGRVLAGVPHREIVKCAEEWAADLIVMGTMGRTGIARAIVGSTAERVVRTAKCPVLTVRPAGRSRGKPAT